jgi:hypothetical protein
MKDYKLKLRDLVRSKLIFDLLNERLQTKAKRFTRLSYTGLVVELEHLKIKTRLHRYSNKREVWV